ncbi:metallophosphoesterase family protein [Lacticaseibacillus paracasei]|uniref:metallophosphoesterase family protein n=1 Tax=Lacticaseibacillus paracasei TaxID=1597 RepID=UPI003DAA3BFD
MKIAALYDIHGNYPALKEVLKQVKKLSPDLVVLGGDLIAGPMPLETLSLLKRVSTTFKTVGIMGNNDQDIVDIYAKKRVGLSRKATEQLTWIANQLSYKQVSFLRNLLPSISIGNYFFCHAVKNDNTTVFSPRQNKAYIEALFKGVQESYIICGHTHIQFELSLPNKKIINAGSIGMPFSNQFGAQWLWLEDNRIEYKRTIFNQQVAIQLISQTEYPFKNEFIANNLRSTISLSQGYSILNTLIRAQNAQHDLS